MLTILLLAHNEKNFAIATIESIRSYKGKTDINLILVDNASTDGLDIWASEQEDISYAYMDKGLELWGSALNQVIDGFEIDTDILVMQSRFMLLPESLENMQAFLHSDEKVGLVGPVTTRANSYQQQTTEKLTDEDSVIRYAENHKNDKPEQALSVECGIFMIRGDVLKNIRFEEGIGSLYFLIKDYSLQVISMGLRVYVCRDVLLYELPTEYPENVDTLSFCDNDSVLLERKWGMHYFNTSGNPYILSKISPPGEEEFKVLEIGCDCGATLLDIKNAYPNAKTFGCDIAENAVEIAKAVTDKAFVADIYKEDLPFEKESLDYVIFGDVLEHLLDPAQTLRYVNGLLKPKGKVIASIPNLMNISVIKDLLKGYFTYTETGLLDKTHIHLFTYNEILKIFRETGFTILDMKTVVGRITKEENELIDLLLSIEPEGKKHMYETFQYVVTAEKE